MGATVSAEPITYPQALDKALLTAQIPTLEASAGKAAEACIQQAGSLPNPSLLWSTSSLEEPLALMTPTKRTRVLSTSLDFIWKRGARIKAAKRRAEIAQYQLINQQRQIAYELAQTFVNYDSLVYERRDLAASLVALERANKVLICLVDRIY